MGQVDITIKDRTYTITCDDGQEGRLIQLGAFFNKYVNELSSELSQVGDTRLMLLSALTVCDALFEEREKASSLEKANEKLSANASEAIKNTALRIREISTVMEKA